MEFSNRKCIFYTISIYFGLCSTQTTNESLMGFFPLFHVSNTFGCLMCSIFLSVGYKLSVNITKYYCASLHKTGVFSLEATLFLSAYHFPVTISASSYFVPHFYFWFFYSLWVDACMHSSWKFRITTFNHEIIQELTFCSSFHAFVS